MFFGKFVKLMFDLPDLRLLHFGDALGERVDFIGGFSQVTFVTWKRMHKIVKAKKK